MPLKYYKVGQRGRGLVSFYHIVFPLTNIALYVSSNSPLLERITAKAEAKNVPCFVRWLVDREVKWQCHLESVSI